MRTLDPIEHVRSHREMYLPGGRSDAAHLATRLAGDALLLGAGCVEVSRDGDWWWVAADQDWLDTEGPLAAVVRDAFSRVVPFPEAGVNAVRSEVLIAAFADEVVTVAHGTRDVIKGGNAGPQPVRDTRVGPGSTGRVVGFRLGGPRDA